HSKGLANLLEPFGVHPRNHRTGPKTVPKGYYREDLEPLWQRHLPELKPTTVPVAANLQNSGPTRPGVGTGNLKNPVNPQHRLEASSQKPVAAVPVAANLQNSGPARPGVGTGNLKDPLNPQQRPAASSQKPGADLKPTIGERILALPRQVPVAVRKHRLRGRQ